MSGAEAAIVLAGALAGGFVNGLTGFGTALTTIGIWLLVLPPTTAAPLIVISSVVSQMQTLPAIWRHIDWQRAWPFIVPGILGAPIGATATGIVDAANFKLVIGAFLVLYALYSLLLARPSQSNFGGRPADAAVGFVGGVLGGLAGLSGALLVLWTDFRGGSKDARRTILQVFNFTVLLAALLWHAGTGHVTSEVGWAATVTLPGTMLGAWLGFRAYKLLGDHQYRRIVLFLLLASGLMLVATNRQAHPSGALREGPGGVQFVALASAVRTL